MPKQAVNRPTSVECAICGVEVAVKAKGAIPRYCDVHRDPSLREKINADEEARKNRVCRWEFCSIPLAEDWSNDYCPNHWRLLSLETRALLIEHEHDSQGYDRGILHATREIKRYEGRAEMAAERVYEAGAVEVG